MPTVLVADDNSNIQKMVGLALEERGIAVIAVGNGEAAVRKLQDAQPDVVLADVFMPVRNGYEVCEFIKKDPKFSHIPVILLIGAFDPLDEKEVHRVGANGVLKKPFVPPDPLIAMVTGFVAGAEKHQAAAAAPQPVAEEKPAPPPVAEESPEPEPQPEEFAFPSSPVALQKVDEDEESPASQEEPAQDWRREAASFEVPDGIGASTSLVDESSRGSQLPATESTPLPEASIPESQPASVVDAAPSSDLAGNATEWLDMMTAQGEQDAAHEAFHVSEVPSEELVSDAAPEEPASQSQVSSEPPAGMLWQPAAGAPMQPEEHTAPSGLLEELRVPQISEPPELSPLAPATFDTPPLGNVLPSDAAAFRDEIIANASESISGAPMEHEGLPPLTAPSFEPIPVTPDADATLVDSIVTRVLERMEPQIREILTREVLRPLAESLLQQELQKK